MSRRPIPRALRLADDADWSAQPPDFAGLGTPRPRFSWLDPRTLWRSRNNVLASLTGDPTEHARRAWVAERRAALTAAGAPPETVADFTLARPDLDEFAFMLMGDTGEGDTSQYAIVPAFLRAAEGTEFALIASDVVYPDGDVNDYVEKFFVPYAGYPRPIYAVPGNHDWLDGLAGFMRHFCGAAPPARKLEPPPADRWRRTSLLLHRMLWRRPRALAPATLARAERLRGAACRSGPRQPNMYFCIDTPRLRIVCIDFGILGRLDAEQGAWLRRVSAGDKPKLLIAGKPIYAGGTVSPRRILGGGSVLGILRDPANNYVAMICGDLHHYQRHPARLADGRTMQFVISGGGGAFMSATHPIARADAAGASEDAWVVFPTRGDSLRAYSIQYLRRMRRLTPLRRDRPVRGIPADEAAAIVARRHGLDLAAELARGEGAAAAGDVRVSLRSRLLAAAVFPRRIRGAGARVSETLDWDDPPFFKNFLRVEVRGGRLAISALGASGRADAGGEAVEFDRVEIAL